MAGLEPEQQFVTAVLPNGAEIMILAEDGGGSRDVSVAGKLGFEQVEQAIEGMGAVARRAIGAYAPDLVEVEFGIDVKIEGGKLAALLINGTGGAALRLKLAWRLSDGDQGRKTYRPGAEPSETADPDS